MKNVKGGFVFIDMSEINADFTSGTAVTPAAEKQEELLGKVTQTGKAIMMCNLHAHASTTHYGTYSPFIPQPFIKDTGTSGHVKYISKNVFPAAKDKTVTITLDTTSSTGVTTVTVTCATAS